MKFKLLDLKLLFAFTLLLTIVSCDVDSIKKTSMDEFVGEWELKGRSMLDGVQIDIQKNNSGQLVGKVKKINENKFVRLFVEEDDTWISSIKRSSNSEFKLSEKKVGNALFATYDLSTSKEYKVQFIHRDTIALGTKSKDPRKSKVFYIRIK